MKYQIIFKKHGKVIFNVNDGKVVDIETPHKFFFPLYKYRRWSDILPEFQLSGYKPKLLKE